MPDCNVGLAVTVRAKLSSYRALESDKLTDCRPPVTQVTKLVMYSQYNKLDVCVTVHH